MSGRYSGNDPNPSVYSRSTVNIFQHDIDFDLLAGQFYGEINGERFRAFLYLVRSFPVQIDRALAPDTRESKLGPLPGGHADLGMVANGLVFSGKIGKGGVDDDRFPGQRVILVGFRINHETDGNGGGVGFLKFG